MYKFSFNFANQSRSLEEVKKIDETRNKIQEISGEKKKEEKERDLKEVGNKIRGKNFNKCFWTTKILSNFTEVLQEKKTARQKFIVELIQ